MVPRQYSESLRQHQDTYQTPSRQPSDIPKHLVEKEPTDQITLIGSTVAEDENIPFLVCVHYGHISIIILVS